MADQPAGHDVASLRRGVLAVAVLDDVDLDPAAEGVVLPSASGLRSVTVGWPLVAAARGGDAPEAPVTRLRTATLLRTAALLADGAPDATWTARHVRALALPPGHALHPGPRWVLERVLGGVLDVGLGLVDVPWASAGGASAEAAVPLAPGAVEAAGPDTAPLVAAWWPTAREHARRMGALAGARVTTHAPGTLRPVGGCDVLTLLSTRALRSALASSDGSGMRATAVPTRSRGWYDLRRIDPAFCAAVWSATDEPARGLPRPLLVTRDEVVLARAGGDPLAQSLDRPSRPDDAPADPPTAPPEPTAPTADQVPAPAAPTSPPAQGGPGAPDGADRPGRPRGRHRAAGPADG